MKIRRLATLAVLGGVLIGTTGCNMISTQATLIQYEAADGVNVDAGTVLVRDALVVANPDGTLGNFVGAVINHGDDTQTLRIEFGEDGTGGTETVRVRAGETLTLGHEQDPVLLEGIDALPGTYLPVYFTAGSEPGALTLVPVIDDTLPYYEGLVPEE